MPKIFQRRPSQYNRDQAGCTWGLISIFDFRHGRSTRKLLGDKRRVSKLEVGSPQLYSCSTGRCQDFVQGEEIKMAETSVKELMKEEIFKEHGSKKQANEFEINLPQIDSEHRHHIKINYKQRNRILKTPSDMDVPELDTAKCLIPENFHKVPEQKPSDTFDLEIIMDQLSRIHQKGTSCTKHDHYNDLNMPSSLEFSIVEAKLVEATKVLIEHGTINGKHFGEEGKIHCSEELMDALETLSSNKGLFLKLMQDPNSVLVKHIQNLEDAQLKKVQMLGSLSEEKRIISKSDDLVNGRRRKFFSRRSKSQSLERYPLGGNKKCQASSKIVILRPGPAVLQNLHTDVDQLHYTMGNKARDERSTSRFSFTEIRRKLRHAVGKEKRGISLDGLMLKFPSKHQNGNARSEGSGGENVGWSSPNRNHFYTENFGISSTGYKRSERIGKSKDKCSEMMNEISQDNRKGVSNIYVEAKKHLFEMLNNEDNKAESTGRHISKSLGRILSLPEYNSSPCCSPRKYNDGIIKTAQTRLSPRGIVDDMNCLVQENYDSSPSPAWQNLESQPHSVIDNPSEKVQSLNANANTPFRDNHDYTVQTQCCTEDVINPEVPSSSSRFREMEGTTDLRHQEVDDGASSIQCLKSDSIGRDGLFSSPTLCRVTRDVENYTLDKIEGPSPVSVLEPFFTENDTSPIKTISRQVEKEIQPQQIHFEEESSASEDEESAYEYVEAILLGSGLNWDDFLLRWLCLCQILEPSVFDEVELFPSQSRHDQKLLFDCTNHVLEEVCESYFGCFTGISYNNLNILPVPKRMDLIQEVWKRVERHLIQHLTHHSVDQHIKRDMEKSGNWMNIRVDIEHIGIEMEETIFDELVEDSILSSIDYISGCKYELNGT